MWSKDSYLRKQHDGKDWASNHRPSVLKFNALTATPPRPRAPAPPRPRAPAPPRPRAPAPPRPRAPAL